MPPFLFHFMTGVVTFPCMIQLNPGQFLFIADADS